ncbi:hypothetical protein PSCICG_41940 [Pseudomonas cichorii]|nr:hypothetical protein PSCICG_41940 [Pseudomonas cichorii]
MSSAHPYFFSESLKARFAKSVKEAVDQSRISADEGKWLGQLVEETNSVRPLPRVDSLVMDNGSLPSAELSGALLISKPLDSRAPVFLSTLLFGVERFVNREAMVVGVKQRFEELRERVPQIDAQLIEGELFETSMESIVRQQVQHLDDLSGRLHQIPSLQTALGKALQQRLALTVPGNGIDVFNHPVHLVEDRSGRDMPKSLVVGTQTLAQIALHKYAGTEPGPGLTMRFMDRQGHILNPLQAQPYIQALNDVRSMVSDTYGKLLDEYWSQVMDDGRTVLEFAAHALAESVRQTLLTSVAQGTLSDHEFRCLRPLLQSSGVAADHGVLTVSRIAVSIGDQGPVKLAGVFLIEFMVGQQMMLYLFSWAQGFRRYADRKKVAEHFSSLQGRAELAGYASLEDRSLIEMQGHIKLRVDTLTAPWFPELVKSIVRLQKANLLYVLDLPAIAYQKVSVRIDDALDIRGLLDKRLLSLSGSGRWLAGQREFGSSWKDSPAATTTEQGDCDYPLLKAWADKMLDLDRRMERLIELHPGVEACVHQALNRYLAIVGGEPMDAAALWVSNSDAGGQAVRLLSLALERISRPGFSGFLAGMVVKGQDKPLVSQPEQRLPLALLESILQWALRDFAARYDQQQRDFYYLPTRRGNTQINPGIWAAHSRENALRLELSLERYLEVLDGPALNMVQQVMDRPLPALRDSLGDDKVEVCMLSLHYDPDQPSIYLANAFVLFNRKRPDRYVLWTMLNGLTNFKSLRELKDNLLACLKRMDRIENVLELLSGRDRQILLDHIELFDTSGISVMLQVVDGHLINALQKAENQRQRETVSFIYERAITWDLKPDLFGSVLAITERDDGSRQAVNDLGAALQVMIYKAIAPLWVTQASLEDLVTLVNQVQRFYVTCGKSRDFLFGVPDVRSYVRDKLNARFTLDFPESELDPDKLVVTVTQHTPTPAMPGQTPSSLPVATRKMSESLIDFALNRFSSIQDGTFSIANEDGSPLTELFTVAYLRELVHSLDVATSYRRVVDSLLSKQSSSYGLRQTIFNEQVPIMEVLKAFILKLKQKLSAQAYAFIKAIFEMPDGVARLPVGDCNVVLSPLLILPAPVGWNPTRVSGLYVIAPQPPQAGPWILYAPYCDDWTFKEYADQKALVTDLCSSESFQTYVLDRMDPLLRHIYDHGGFQEPHLPFSVEDSMSLPFERPLPVTFSLEPVKGNALEYLCPELLEGFKFEVRHQSVTNSEFQSASSKYLFGLVAEQVLTLMPGRLGALVGVWQSSTMLHSSVISLGEHRWGQAMSDFVTGLGVLISVRQEPHKGLLPDLIEEENILPEEPSSFPEFSWNNNALTEQIRSRLSTFEVHDVALNELHQDEVFNVSRDARTGNQYAAVEGRLYQVRFDIEGWFVVSKDERGPAIRLDTNQRWKFQLQGGLKGGGGMVSRAKSSQVEQEANDQMVIDARGMYEIRQVYRDRAQCIEQGHAQARRYLENCLDNLKLQSEPGAIDPRVERIVAGFFDIRRPDARVYASIKNVVTKVYEELISPSLSPVDSQRYIVGFNKRGHEASTAFVFVKDPLKRIFLTEQFFRVPSYRFKVSVIRAGSFNYGDHYRATILIHELSHMVAGTEDIAYVDSYAPFIDLLEDTPGYRLRIKNEQIIQQQKSLSYQTERNQLFRQAEDTDWQDLKRGEAKSAVLRIAGKKTLEEARDVFYRDAQKRVDIILNNADSVALLVSLIGRQRFT